MQGNDKKRTRKPKRKTDQVTAQTADSQWMADDKDGEYKDSAPNRKRRKKGTHRRDKAVDAEI